MPIHFLQIYSYKKTFFKYVEEKITETRDNLHGSFITFHTVTDAIHQYALEMVSSLYWSVTPDTPTWIMPS